MAELLFRNTMQYAEPVFCAGACDLRRLYAGREWRVPVMLNQCA